MLKVLAVCPFIALAFVVAPSLAQPKPAIPAAKDLEQNVGGYSKADPNDKGVLAAAKFAVKSNAKKKEKNTLAKVLSAESQIVAGTNYALTLDVQVKGGLRTAHAVVYQKLDGAMELSKWEWKGEVRPAKKK